MTVDSARVTVGIIAGAGRFPILVADGAKTAGCRVVAVAIKGEAPGELADHVEDIRWAGVAQLGKMIRHLKDMGATRAVLAGRVTKGKMYSPLRYIKYCPDLRTLNLWFRRVQDKRDGTLLTAVADELECEGIHLEDSTTYVPDQLASEGCMTKKHPTAAQQKDIDFGIPIASELTALDIGQTIVVKEQVVVALEGVEGTDETIRRAHKLAGRNLVVIKASRPNQDFRFDVPTVGLDTLPVLRQCCVSVLAIEADRTLMLDRSEVIKEADKLGIAIVGFRTDG